MKKEVLSAIGAALVCGLVLLLVLLPSNSAVSGTTGPTAPIIKPTTRPTTTGPNSVTRPTTSPTQPTTQPTVPPTTVPTTTEPTDPVPPETTVPPAPGVVRVYTCDQTLLAVYAELAAEYYQATGTEVILQAPEAGQSCEEALTALLNGDNAPTLFCIHTQEMFEKVQHQLYDLTGTHAAQQLYGDAFAIKTNGKTLALALDVAGNGLIYNASKLAAAAWTDEDLVDFTDLSIAVSNITANKGYAFTAPDFTDTHLMEHLAGLYPDGAQLRAFVDLYFKNCTSKTTTLNYFLKGTTVFYIGGTRDYDQVASLGAANLRFLPAYSASTTAVQCFSDHYWAVGSNASNADIQETILFLNWMVTARNGSAPVDRLGLLSPYQDAKFCRNILEEKLREYIVSGNANVSWSVTGNVKDLDAFTAALKAYKSSATEENWAAVVATLG